MECRTNSQKDGEIVATSPHRQQHLPSTRCKVFNGSSLERPPGRRHVPKEMVGGRGDWPSVLVVLRVVRTWNSLGSEEERRMGEKRVSLMAGCLVWLKGWMGIG